MKTKFKKLMVWLKDHVVEIFILLIGFFFGSLLTCYLIKNLFIAVYAASLWGGFFTYVMIITRRKIHVKLNETE